jgi:hypothetical protein
MKELIKKWWFWLIIIITIIVLTLILQYISQKQVEDSVANIGNAMTEFYTGIERANTHLDEFTYNYETGEVKYKPSKITLEMFNKVKDGMKKSEVIAILGNGDELHTEESKTYMMTWGNLDLDKAPYYRIQIIFNENNEVISSSQLGL